MNKTVIALAPGQAGYYDELSGVYLTLAKKEASVGASVNTVGLRTAVKEGKIIVVSGSLELEATSYMESDKMLPNYYRIMKATKESIPEVQEQEVVSPINEVLDSIKEKIVTQAKIEVEEPKAEEVVVKKTAKRKKKADKEE